MSAAALPDPRDQDRFHIVLVNPEIPPNTGSIARLCGATDTVLHLVHPLGFATDDRHLKRAGLDYWPQVRIRHWQDLDNYLEAVDDQRLHLFTKKAARPYWDCRFRRGDHLVFGRESVGLPGDLLSLYADRTCAIPITNPRIRSLNLAMAAGIALYEALRQQAG